MNYQLINKQNVGKWEEALNYLTDILKTNGIPYYLSASGLNYILSSNIYPYDIDLFISKEDIPKAFTLLNKYTTTKIHKWENTFLEFQGIYNDIPFEICEWEETPDKMINIPFKDMEVSILPPK